MSTVPGCSTVVRNRWTKRYMLVFATLAVTASLAEPTPAQGQTKDEGLKAVIKTATSIRDSINLRDLKSIARANMEWEKLDATLQAWAKKHNVTIRPPTDAEQKKIVEARKIGISTVTTPQCPSSVELEDGKKAVLVKIVITKDVKTGETTTKCVYGVTK